MTVGVGNGRWGGSALVAFALLVGTGAGHPEPATAANASSDGNIFQFPDARGCIAHDDKEGCKRGPGLQGPRSVVVSPDSRHVYVASNVSSAVTAFRRIRDGVLKRVDCVIDQPIKGCRRGLGLSGSSALALSPDGRHLYVAVEYGLAVFERNLTSGRLNQLDGPMGCVSERVGKSQYQSQYPTPGCAAGHALANVVAVTVSPNGDNVYAAAERSSAVAAFSRNQESGAIVQLDGLTGCISSDRAEERCSAGVALGGARGLAISPDGRHVYAAGSSVNSIVVLGRGRDGVLTQAGEGLGGCIDPFGDQGCDANGRGLMGPRGVTVSRDGRNVYVASVDSSAVASFRREEVTGRLFQTHPGAFGCTSQYFGEGCSLGRGLRGASAVAMSPDDRGVYAVSATAATRLYRNPRIRGSLTQFPRVIAACTHQGPESAGAGRADCLSGHGLRGGKSIALSPDGLSAYVAAADSNAVAVFSRDPSRARLKVHTSGAPRRCTQRNFRVRARVESTLAMRSISAHLNGRLIGSVVGRRTMVVRVNARRSLRPRRHRLRFLAIDVAGNRKAKSIRFSRCARGA